MELLIPIMAIGREYINMDFSFEDSINKSMLFGYLTAPSAFGLTFQWLWMPQPRFGMLIKFTNKLHGLFVDFWARYKAIFSSLLAPPP